MAEESIDKSTAYLLFYEREGLSISDYLPRFDSQLPLDTKDLEEELEVEFDGVVVSEYLASVLQQSPDRAIFTLDLSTLVELDLFSTTTTVS